MRLPAQGISWSVRNAANSSLPEKASALLAEGPFSPRGQRVTSNWRTNPNRPEKLPVSQSVGDLGIYARGALQVASVTKTGKCGPQSPFLPAHSHLATTSPKGIIPCFQLLGSLAEKHNYRLFRFRKVTAKVVDMPTASCFPTNRPLLRCSSHCLETPHPEGMLRIVRCFSLCQFVGP